MKRHLENSSCFICDICSFSTSKKSKYEVHKQTAKHIRNVNITSQIHVSNDDSEYLPGTEAVSDNETVSPDHPTSFDEDHHLGQRQRNQEIDDEDSRDEALFADGPSREACGSGDSSWYPFVSKMEMLLYILLHSKTHILSDETAKFIWYIMQEAGLEMPPMSKIKNMTIGSIKTEDLIQKNLNAEGVPFYSLKPSALLQLTISHPDTSQKIIRHARKLSVDRNAVEFYEQPDGNKFHNLQWHWASYNNKQFYAGDFVVENSPQTRIGKINSFIQDIELDAVYAVVQIYDKLENHANSLICSTTTDAKMKLQHLNHFNPEGCQFYKRDTSNNLQLVTLNEKTDILSRSRFCVFNMPVIMLPVNLFFDDTSANKSRKWKPLHCIQMQLAGLPNNMKQNQKSIKFIAASTDVSIMDLIKPVVEDLKDMKNNGLVTYDAKLKKEIVLTTDISACICDFNMHAEAANHMGPSTKKFCPRCYAEAPTFINKGISRTPAKTKQILSRLSLNNSKDMRQKYGLKPYENCLWDVINPHSDIPVGQLHWMYLGLAKHVLSSCIKTNEQKSEMLASLIESMDLSSFATPISPDIIKYLDSRQGKDIKNYLQIAPLHMALAGFPVEMVKVICRLSELSKIFSQTTEYGEHYLATIDSKIQKFLRATSDMFPLLVNKVKMHLSTHIVDDIRNHGPPTGYVEDAFEKLHGRIREQLFIQNQHARSRDTALAFAEMEVLQHIITGGFFKENNEWVQASPNVIMQASERKLKSFLGWNEEIVDRKGVLKKGVRTNNSKLISTPVNDSEFIIFQSACDMHAVQINLVGSTKKEYKSVTTKSGENTNMGTPVLYKTFDGQEELGIFKMGYDIQPATGRSLQLVKLQQIEKINDIRVNGVQCEAVKVVDKYVHVLPSSVLHTICLVHACNTGFCRMKETFVNVRLEQEIQQIRKKIWSHNTEHNVYYINRYSFVHAKEKYFP